MLMSAKQSKQSKKKGLHEKAEKCKIIPPSAYHQTVLSASFPGPDDYGKLLASEVNGEEYRTEPLLCDILPYFVYSGCVVSVKSISDVKTVYVLSGNLTTLYAVAVACPALLPVGANILVYGFVGRNDTGHLSLLCEAIVHVDAKSAGEFDFLPCFPGFVSEKKSSMRHYAMFSHHNAENKTRHSTPVSNFSIVPPTATPSPSDAQQQTPQSDACGDNFRVESCVDGVSRNIGGKMVGQDSPHDGEETTHTEDVSDGEEIETAFESHLSIALTPQQTTPAVKKFTVNGAITQLSSPLFFRVPTSASNENLYQKIRNRECVYFHGQRASGKSTRIDQAVIDLRKDQQDLTVWSIDILGISACQTLNEAWRFVSAALLRKGYINTGFADSSGFMSLFTWPVREDPSAHGANSSGRIVLFIDELDDIMGCPADIVSDILKALRTIKGEKDTNRWQATVGIGVYSILSLDTTAGSPFSVIEAVQCPSFNLEEVKGLFRELQAARADFTMDDAIAEDVYFLSDGHPGTVCLLGRSIDQGLRTGKQHQYLTFEEWAKASSIQAVEWVSQYASLNRIVEKLTQPDKDIHGLPGQTPRQLREFIQTRVLNTAVPLTEDLADGSVLKYLTSLGVLKSCRSDDGREIYRLSSPVIGRLLMSKVLDIPRGTANVNYEKFENYQFKLDMPRLLQDALLSITAEDIAQACAHSIKSVRAAGGNTIRVPHECWYQFKILCFIVHNLSRSWTAHIEAKSVGARKRLDILIRRSAANDDGRETRYVVELLATAEPATLAEHFHRMEDCGKLLDAAHLYCVHCIAVDQLIPRRDEVMPTPLQKVHFISAAHTQAAEWSLQYCCCSCSYKD